MYELDGQQFSVDQISAWATQDNKSVEEYVSAYGFSQVQQTEPQIEDTFSDDKGTYSVSQISEWAKQDGKTVEEYATAYGLKKEQPQTPGAPVGGTAAPDMESKSEDGSSESQDKGMIDRIGDWFGGLIGDIQEATRTAETQAELTDTQALIAEKMEEVGEVKVEDVMKLVELDEKGLKEGLTDSEESLHSTYDSIETLAKAKAATGMGPMTLLPPAAQAFLGSMMLEPKGAMVSIVRSMASMAKSEAAREGALTTAIPSAVGTAALTSGTGPGAFISGVGALFAGAMAGANLTMETALTLHDLVKDEVDDYENLSKQEKAEALVDVFNDKDKYEKILLRAEARGVAITAIDLATGKVGGAAVSKVTKGALKKGVSKLAQGTAEIAVEEGIEKAGAYGGELLGQAAAGQELNFKDAAMEAIGGFEVVTRPGGAAFKGIKTIAKPSSYSIRGREVSREQLLKFINANDGVDLAAASATIEIEGDNDVKDLLTTKARKAIIKTDITENVTNEADRDKIAELELERAKLKNNKTRLAKERLSEVEAEIDAIGLKYKPRKGRPSKLTIEAREKLKADADRVKKAWQQRGLAKTLSFAEEVGKKYGLNIVETDNTKDFKRKIVEVAGQKNAAIPSELLKKIELVGGTAVGNTIVINKEVAAATGQFNVGAHEVLHPIVNAKLYSLDNANEIIDGLKNILSERQVKAIERQLDLRQYKDSDTRAKEFLTVMSDMMNVKDKRTGKTLLDLDENNSTWQQIGQWLMDNIFRPLGFGTQAGFADSKQVYQFMRDYQKSIQKGKLTKATEKAIGKLEISDSADFELSKSSRTDIDALGADQTKEEWDKTGANMAIADLYAEGVLDALMGSKITQDMRALPGFSEDDFISEGVAELIQHIRNFNPEKNDSLNGWIMSQLANKAKSVLKKGKATQSDFTQDIDSGRQIAADDSYEISADFDQMDEFDFDSDQYDEEGGLINPLDFINKADLDEFRSKIREALNKTEALDKLTLKTLGDLVPEITQKVTGIPVNKLNNPKANLTTGEVKTMQQFIYDNADLLIKLLPEGAVLEAASEKLIGTGTNVPRKLLQNFYNKNPRTTKGAGLSPFEKMENIDKNFFLDVFGINPDGSFKNFGGQDQRAQTIFALGRLVGELMTNTAVRQELEVQKVNRNIIVDIGAGRSEWQLSSAAIDNIDEDARDTTTYQENHSNTVANNRQLLKSTHGLTDAQIDELEAESVKHTRSKAARGVEWNLEAYLAHEQFAMDVIVHLPEILKQSPFKGLILSTLGMHALYSPRHVNFDNKQSHSVLKLDENGNRVRLSNEEVKSFVKNQKEYYKKKSPINFNAKENIHLKEALENLQKSVEELGDLKELTFLKKARTRKIKLEYQGKNLAEVEAMLPNLFDLKEDTVRVNAHKLFTLSMQHYFESLPKGEQRLNALKQFKKIYSSSGIADGFKSMVKLGGFVHAAEANNRVYHFEHVVSATQMYTEMFENLITGERNYSTPEAWFIPLDLAKGLDQTIYKTAKRNDFIKKLREEAAARGDEFLPSPHYGESKFQASLAPALTEMVDNSLNEMVSEKLNIDDKSTISEFQARRLGKNKGRFKFFIPPSADDFMGLMYYLVRKGRQGDADLQFIKESLIKPFADAQRKYEEYKMSTLKGYRQLKKSIRNTPANLKKEAVMGFTNEQALRAFMWNELGYEVPGVSQAELSAIRNHVNSNAELLEFSKQIQNMLLTDFPQPQENWAAGSLTIDILEHINEQARKKFFENFINVAEETFGKMDNRGEIQGPLANKLRAAFGDNYVEALSDVLYRMKVGRSRQFGRNRLVSQLENYINGSIATIMFFNTRSAILQMVSFVNFINFSDNNPIAAAQAYANIPQLSSDVMELMNSDYLVARRNGLKIDVAADDIAKSAESTTNRAGAAISTILRAGYLPTQFADSFAIAFGGATFYRNRIKTYMNEGLSEAEAKEKAYSDWKETAEESQQSSRPDKISQQQASTLGRLVLAFGNTPMQYARITKKAALDLLAGRGDFKTNMSKMLYYGAVQNLIFSGLQQALFSLWLDDEPDEDDEEVNKYVNVVDSAIDGFGRGLGYGGAIAVMVKNVIQEVMDEYGEGGRRNFQDVILEIGTLSPAISSKISRLEQGARTFTWKQELEKVRTEGFSLDNPAFEATGKFTSALTNVPLDRVIRKIDNLSYPMRHEVQTWQAIALALGWGQWELGLKEVNKKEKSKKEKIGFRKPKVRKPLTR